MSFAIRRAAPEQAGILTAIAFAAKRHWAYPESWIEYWAPLLTITPKTITGFETWYAQLGGEIAGFHVLMCSGTRASLEHLWVLPSHMGQGIGRALFEHAVGLARLRGCSVLEIESDPNAVGFYRRMGAVPAGERAGQVDDQPRLLPMLIRQL